MSEDKKPDPSTSPSWQTTTPSPSSAPTPEKAVQEDTHQTAETTIAISTTSSTEQEKLLELVNRFLQDPNVQNASVDKKMSFLTSKGLSKEQAEKALNASQDSSSTTNTSSPQDTASAESDAPQPQPSYQPQPTSQSPQQQPPSSPIPPIITYPESLLPTTTTPPLITPARLTTFAYALATLSATVYGTSTYLINPMLNALHDARHDFATHAQSKIDGLNEKLGGVVSVDPSNPAEREKKKGGDEEHDDDEEDAGRALFTSPTNGAHSTTSSSSSTSPNTTTTTPSPSQLTNHSADSEIASLTKISTLLSTVQTTQSDTDSTNSDVRKAVHELNDYLLGLASSAYSGTSSYYGGSVYGKEAEKEKKNDEVANVKKEIRGIKGMFVSGRKFPVPSVTSVRR